MASIRAHLFRSSFGPFVDLLKEHDLDFQMREVRSGGPMASGGTIEIVQAVAGAAIWTSLAAVIVAFIKARSGRKVVLTMKNGTILESEGLTAEELTKVLELADHLTASAGTEHQSPPIGNQARCP